MHRIALSLLLLVVAHLLVGAARAADPYAVTFEPDVAMKTRDGVTLYADIFRPKADGSFPSSCSALRTAKAVTSALLCEELRAATS